MRLFVLARHGQSTLNVERRVNGDPRVDVPLTADGTANARRLGAEIAGLPIELALHTRFARTRRTAEVALEGRMVPLVEEPLLDDVDVGELEGRSIDDYRAWKRGRRRSERFPGGESLDEAARRYAEGYERLLARRERVVLVVCHEIAVRYAVNGAAGSDSLDRPLHDVPNATPFLFDGDALARAVAGIRRLSS
ncbi:MAG TPA: histidine phosphatase family protein [Gaiellaceae bacterium]|nr:histidine phosphatase family protein [Gaiellaceae bacterium]